MSPQLSNWFLYGPFKFEASATLGSARVALTHLTEQMQSPDLWGKLHHPAKQPDLPGRTDARKPGLYLIFHTEEELPPLTVRRSQQPLGQLRSKPQLAGFWVMFGTTYLGEGVAGPPDRVPPYASGFFEACTEEVWWKNLEVYPKQGSAWRPVVVFEWGSELAFRCERPPPGIPLSPDEIADPEAEDKLSGDWLEHMDEEVVREERRRQEALRKDNPWLDLSHHRCLMMIVQGYLHKKRVTHECSYRMVHPEWLGAGGESRVVPLKTWLGQVFQESAPEKTDRTDHYLGQPIELPGGRVGFPASGWLTRNLTMWPPMPVDIRTGRLSPRDIGSKLVAQLREASAVTSMVLVLLVALSWLVYMLTRPPLVAVSPPPEIVPEPAMSVCSADHARFMDEFRCQIESFVYGVGTNQPVCGDRGSKEIVRSTRLDLQAEYCGMRDRIDDGWVWPPGSSENTRTFNFGYVAASKACFNVLGQPYNYRLPKDFSANVQTDLPDPDLFLNDPDLSIRGLRTLIAQLDTACDAYKERMEYQVEGAVFATHVGTTPQDITDVAFEDQQEAAKLRLRLTDQVMTGVKSDLRQCFERGLDEGQDAPRHLGELCGFAEGTNPETGENPRNDIFNKRKIWQELMRGGDFSAVQDVAGTLYKLESVVARYNLARFGNPLLPLGGQRTTDLWKCHEKLTSDPSGSQSPGLVWTIWDLKIPVPSAYRIEGAAAKSQLALDAALRSFSAEGSSSKSDAGPCWEVTARRLVKYTPVHPLLAEPDPAGWPTEEQQICGQICAARYRVKATAAAAEWVTPGRDLQMCVSSESPVGDTIARHTRSIARIQPGDEDAAAQLKEAMLAFSQSIDRLSPISGAERFDQLLVPWHQRPERTMEQVVRAYSGAVQRGNPDSCEDIEPNASLYMPSGADASEGVLEACRKSDRRLSEEDRELCQHYQQLVPAYDALEAECRLAAKVGVGEVMSRAEFEKYVFDRIQIGEGWVQPNEDQICAFNLIAQGYLHDDKDAFLNGGLAPPAWAGQTFVGSRIAGGGLASKEAEGAAYQAATSLSRYGRTRSLNTCSYAASQCFAEKLMDVMADPDTKPFDWKEEWERSVALDLLQADQRGVNRLKELSPWCSLIEPYMDLQEGDIDYPCARGVQEARQSVSRTIDYIAAQMGTEG